MEERKGGREGGREGGRRVPWGAGGVAGAYLGGLLECLGGVVEPVLDLPHHRVEHLLHLREGGREG